MPSCVLSIHSAAFFQTAFGRAVIGARRDRVIGVGGWKGRSRSRRMPSGSGRELMDERGIGLILFGECGFSQLPPDGRDAR